MQKIVSFIVVFACGLLLLTACEAFGTQEKGVENKMGLLGKNETYIVSPPFEGHLYDGAKPLANVKIIRKVSYNTIKPNWDEDEFYTDENGYFNIPQKEVLMKLTFLDQFVAFAEFIVAVNNEEISIWDGHTMINEALSYFEGKSPEELLCDVNEKSILIWGDFSKIFTRCRWNEMPEEAKPIFD